MIKIRIDVGVSSLSKMMEYNSHFDGSWSFSWKTVKFGDKSVSFPDSIPYLLLQDRPLSSRPPVAPPRVFTCCHQWHASWYTGDPIPSSWDASRAPTFKIIHSNVPYQDISSYTKINQDISRISDSISHSISPSSQSKKTHLLQFPPISSLILASLQLLRKLARKDTAEKIQPRDGFRNVAHVRWSEMTTDTCDISCLMSSLWPQVELLKSKNCVQASSTIEQQKNTSTLTPAVELLKLVVSTCHLFDPTIIWWLEHGTVFDCDIYI